MQVEHGHGTGIGTGLDDAHRIPLHGHVLQRDAEFFLCQPQIHIAIGHFHRQGGACVGKAYARGLQIGPGSFQAAPQPPNTSTAKASCTEASSLEAVPSGA